MGKYDIAAYVWPSYTGNEPRSRMFWEQGYGEWQTVKSATAKYPGHTWPRKPLWGYVNEADPAVMEMEIEAATSHGVNVFIYDWYWYDNRPFLENCLNDGFLKASNCGKMKFYLMWANHDANHLWNKQLSDTDVGSTVIWKGAVAPLQFEAMYRRLADKYFTKENYYRINGCPVFMIYELSTFIEGMGSIGKAAEMLGKFRDYVKTLGFPGLHLQFTGRESGTVNLSGVDGKSTADIHEVIKTLMLDSFTHYQFVHVTDIDRDYNLIMKDIESFWNRIDSEYEIPYFPHISCGWDNNPRFYGFRPGIVKNNTPENFRSALIKAKSYIDSHPQRPRLITLNSWNEWTETSYLEPDDLYGYGYLEAVKDVFLK